MIRPLLRRARERFAFTLERVFLRGAHVRLLAMALLIGLVAILAGSLARGLDEGFAGFGDAVWWAFLRLTDPGYLGDDEGAVRRSISTVVTVLGYVIFVGALIAILTQWLNQTVDRLQSGLTPIALRNHVVVLGWTTRTPTILEELLLSEGRVRRFLERLGARRLRIAVLVEGLDFSLVADLRDRLGRLWSERRIILRSGNPLRVEHLDRVDFVHSAAILIPGGEFGVGGAAAADTHTIKILLSIAGHARRIGAGRLPLVVAEIFDATKAPIARSAYPGPLELLSSDAAIARLLAQNLRHPGLSEVFREILSHAVGGEIYIRESPGLEGFRFFELAELFPEAVPLGLIRRTDGGAIPILAPPPPLRLEEGDRLVFLASSYEATVPRPSARESAELALETGPPAAAVSAGGHRRVLVLGWSHKVAALLRELDGYEEESFEIDVFSARPPSEREAYLERVGFAPVRLRVRQLEGDYTVPLEMSRIEPDNYDNVVLMASDWLESGEESDARSILGWLLLRDVLSGASRRPRLLIELVDPENVPLFDSGAGEVLISPVILSHMLAQIALRPDLRMVFEEIFGPGGAEIHFRPVSALGLPGGAVTFRELRQAALAHGEIALGVRHLPGDGHGAGEVELNPPPERSWSFAAGCEAIVLAGVTPPSGGEPRP